MIEDIIVVVIVAAVVLIGARSFLRSASGKDGAYGCGGCRPGGQTNGANGKCGENGCGGKSKPLK